MDESLRDTEWVKENGFFGKTKGGSRLLYWLRHEFG